MSFDPLPHDGVLVCRADELRQLWGRCFDEMGPRLRSLRAKDQQRRIEMLAMRYLDGRDELFDLRVGGFPGPPSLAHHDQAYRLQGAALSELRRSGATGVPSRELVELQTSCGQELDLARVRLVLVGGSLDSGAGATAGALGARHGAVVLRHGDHDHGEMLERAERLLHLGEHVVLDAPWADRFERHAAREVALRASSDLVELCCPPADRAMAAWDADAWPEATVIGGGDPGEAFRQASLACGWTLG